MSRPNADSGTSATRTVHPQPVHSTGPSSGLGDVQSAGSSSQTFTSVSDSSLSKAAHIINIAISPKYFEVCINIGNYAIDHHEVDITGVTSDSELFELIWDKYNSSRGIGLRRVFLRPRDVQFVMVSAPVLLPGPSSSC
jgi:hypothetical protein